MLYSDDPVADFERHDREQAKRLAQRPKCDYCNEPVQEDFYYEINGDVICETCLDRFFRKDTDDYVD